MKCKISLSQLPFYLAFLSLPQRTFLDLKQGTERVRFDSFSTFRALKFLGMKNLAGALYSSSLVVSTKNLHDANFLVLLQRNQLVCKKLCSSVSCSGSQQILFLQKQIKILPISTRSSNLL